MTFSTEFLLLAPKMNEGTSITFGVYLSNMRERAEPNRAEENPAYLEQINNILNVIDVAEEFDD